MLIGNSKCSYELMLACDCSAALKSSVISKSTEIGTIHRKPSIWSWIATTQNAARQWSTSNWSFSVSWDVAARLLANLTLLWASWKRWSMMAAEQTRVSSAKLNSNCPRWNWTAVMTVSRAIAHRSQSWTLMLARLFAYLRCILTILSLKKTTRLVTKMIMSWNKITSKSLKFRVNNQRKSKISSIFVQAGWAKFSKCNISWKCSLSMKDFLNEVRAPT